MQINISDFFFLLKNFVLTVLFALNHFVRVVYEFTVLRDQSNVPGFRFGIQRVNYIGR